MSRTRSAVLAICLLCLVLVVGCALPPQARQVVAENAALQTRFVALMEAGQVTEEQLRENAKVNALNWQRLDALLAGE
ncbi:MAG: hypothetical protein AB7D00_14955 [Rhodospirillaceae bacterium]